VQAASQCHLSSPRTFIEPVSSAETLLVRRGPRSRRARPLRAHRFLRPLAGSYAPAQLMPPPEWDDPDLRGGLRAPFAPVPQREMMRDCQGRLLRPIVDLEFRPLTSRRASLVQFLQEFPTRQLAVSLQSASFSRPC
jgi:hypothetical protein